MTCRSCSSDNLLVFLSLGDLPLPDALLRPDELEAPEPRYPLDVAFCRDCTLVQILAEVPPVQLFVENYLYFSSFSDAWLEHARAHALELAARRGLGRASLVVEVASNDGYLLKNLAELGVPVLGIDPAPEPTRAAREAGIPTLQEFFGAELAERLVAEGRRADVIVANNVMAHVPNLNGFVEGFRVLLADDGLCTIENTSIQDLIENCAFDTIYHEHYCYFSCTAVDAVMRRHGLVLNAVEHFPEIQGGALRWQVGHRREPGNAAEFLAAELEHGLTEPAYYQAFAGRVEAIRDELLELLRALKGDGGTIAAYGAAAKGSTLLNYAGIDGELVDFVVDRNPHKHGLHMPGVHLPIRPPEALLEEQPDFVLLLAWNYRDEIVRQQAEYRARGGRFVVPVPAPAIL